MARLIVIALAGIAALASAQEPVPRRAGGVDPAAQPKTTAAPEKPGALEGRVTSVSGEPLRKVEVALNSMGRRGPGPFEPSDPYATTTDAAGNFRFDEVEPGTYMIHATRAGFVPSSRIRGRPQQVVITSGKAVSGVHIKLTPGGVITGKVTDEEGDPLQFTNVQVMQKRYARGQRRLTPMGAGMTNDLGEYRIASLMPGTYYVLVSRVRGPMGAARGATTGYTTTYFPNVTDPNQASPLIVDAGQERSGVDFRLTRQRVFRVRGKVVDVSPAGGQQHVMLSLLPNETGPMWGMVDRPSGAARDGSFELNGVAPGSYILVAMQPRGESRHMARVPVNVTNSNVDGVVVQLAEPIQLAGSLKIEGDAPATLSGIRVDLQPSGAEVMFGGNGGGVTTESGGFAVINLSPGRFKVNVSNTPQGTYLKTIKLAGQESPDGSIELTAGAGPLEIILGTKPGAVSGTVQTADDKPAKDATVVLIPDSTRRQRDDFFKTVRTADDGSFQLTGIAPGDYSIIALNDPEEGSWFDPEFLRPLESKTTAVKIAEGSSQALQLKLQ